MPSSPMKTEGRRKRSAGKKASASASPSTSVSGLERFSAVATSWLGGPAAFVAACAVIVLWAVAGPMFGFSEQWQLVVNTGTTIVTFLMVFLIQRTQNKESLAIQLKLNELVAAIEGASNRLIDVEALGEAELATLREHFHKLSELSGKDSRLTESHSVEEAEERHRKKRDSRTASARQR